MYEINDTVLYGGHGVCRIVEIEERDLCGNRMEYYILKPVYDEKSTVFVPVHNEALTTKMRRILSVDEIYALIASMPNEDSKWIENENERKEKYREIISCGDRIQLIRAIKALYQHQQEQQARGRKLHLADERFFKEAEKMLYDEFALVLHIKPEQVFPFIQEQIHVSKNRQPVQ
ncbi:CarD family transcriptional regulator [Candidatus Soleaferrea massiliensis]|uniref:CarD family transcriptional regulator n=1 Tax=Candidatus Soleaferrea massiliensis TaxID=1470354 RepID=UPI00058FD676|nr:CarD family transcriptional regulator [Candidatus Soleaferrea massiliensis]